MKVSKDGHFQPECSKLIEYHLWYWTSWGNRFVKEETVFASYDEVLHFAKTENFKNFKITKRVVEEIEFVL